MKIGEGDERVDEDMVGGFDGFSGSGSGSVFWGREAAEMGILPLV